MSWDSTGSQGVERHSRKRKGNVHRGGSVKSQGVFRVRLETWLLTGKLGNLHLEERAWSWGPGEGLFLT